MLKNYFTVAWRNISRRPFYTSLNLIGLTTGILFTLLISIYVWQEGQVNKHLIHPKNQYFLTSNWKDPNMGAPITTFGPIAKRLKEEYPGLVVNYFRGDFTRSVVSKGGKHFIEDIDIADNTLLKMFGFELLYGNPATAMQNPYSVLIRKEIAFKYFGRTNVVGETIGILNFSNTVHDFLITGVLKDIPENSVTDLNIANHHKIFIPANTYSYFPRPDRESLNYHIFPSFVELKEGVSPEALTVPLKRLLEKNTDIDTRRNLTIVPIALNEFHLKKDNGLVQRMLFALSFIGLFILLMAIVNFVNISISSSSVRIKEIGIRKVLGGLRIQIVLQFLTESIILVLLATLFAFLIYPAARPLLSEIIGKDLPVLSSFPLSFILFPLLLVISVGLAAGFYPAVKLSSIKSSDSIKGKLKSVRENIWLRRSMVGVQFSLASIVLIAAFIISKQIDYFLGQNLGYNKDYIVSSAVPRNWSPEGLKKMNVIRNEFAAMHEISDATLSYEIPDGMGEDPQSIYRADLDSSRAVATQILTTDEHYLDTYQIPIKAGMFFNAHNLNDTTAVVMNETAARTLGWENAREALGKQVRFPGYPPICTIMGITGDFHFSGMQQKIPPIVYQPIFYNCRYITFKLKAGNIAKSIRAIEKKWSILMPGSSFEYRFKDETLKRLYGPEIQLKKAVYTGSLLSMVIVLLGVTGLVSLSIQKRTKEIGIRKVLGASATGIMKLFMKDFLIIILVSSFIACPVVWIIMHHWLDNYAYRVILTPMPFIFSVLGLSVITLSLIGIQALKAGNVNPVISLRPE